jgi:peptidoglycan/LPS O-acetylase OafA/YrhL
MTRATSLFLDGLRLGAALVVFAAHTAHYWNPAMIGPMQAWAHDAVIVFFVLSGYVIAHTTRAGARDARAYAVARLSRLYSVVAPALVLTVVLWVIGRQLEPELYAGYERAFPAIRFAATALFLNAAWTFELSPPTNTPFWSLGYEAWYYVLFGVAVFMRAGGLKWLALGAAAVVAGPKVLLLLPVWLAGVAARCGSEAGAKSLPRSAAALGLAAALAATVWMVGNLPDWPETPGAHPWYFSGAWGSDLAAGLGWGAVIWCFNRFMADRAQNDSMNPAGNWPTRAMRWAAGHTFSLYLYHGPLVILATVLFPPLLVRSAGGRAAVLGGILGLVVVLGALTEGQRRRWRRLFAWGWDKIVVARR